MAVEWKFPACDDVVMNLLEDELDTDPVSYTHLTLPTSDLV